MAHAQLRDLAWLRAQLKAGASLVQIAALVGCNKSTALRAIRRHGLAPAHPPHRPKKEAQ